jgi:sugar phosphate isomerase/epimerase
MSGEFTQRDFGKMAIGAVPLASLALSAGDLFAQAKPNSNFDGVQIGVITYSFNGMPAKDMIPVMAKIGLSAVELMSNHAEELAGAPSAGLGGGRGRGAQAAAPQTLGADGLLPRCESTKLVTVAEGEVPPSAVGFGAEGARAMTPEQQAAQQDAQKKLWEWRAAATPATWKAVRKQFDDAGINLRILCYNLAFPPVTNDEIDYSFRMARDLGVEAVSSTSTVDLIARIAYYADKYKIRWGGHGHDDVTDPTRFSTPATFEYIMSFSPYIGVNLDIGHFTAAGFDAVRFIRQHHDRITNLHLKDRMRNSDVHALVTNHFVDNYPWGQGKTPIKEVLQLMKREKYKFPADIEYEYECRATGTPVEEVGKCLAFARKAIES